MLQTKVNRKDHEVAFLSTTPCELMTQKFGNQKSLPIQCFVSLLGKNTETD